MILSSEQFIKAIENYYGKYSEGVKKVVRQYLATVPEAMLPKIRAQLILTVSTQYGHVPDVATIEVARKEVAKEYAQKQLEYKPSEPDPDALNYREELGEKLTELVERFR